MLRTYTGKAFARIAVALGAAILVTGASAQAQPPIKIGSFLAVTGPAFFLGDPEKKTLELYVQKINQAGGVLGRKLELIVYDSGANAGVAHTFVKRLIENDKVDVLIGGSTTSPTMAAIPLAEKAGIPFISLAGATSITDPVKRWVFAAPQSSRLACAKIFEDMKKRNISTIAIIYANQGFGEDMRKECVQVNQKYGIKIAGEESFGVKDSDMTPQMAKIRALPGLQAVLALDSGQGAAIVTRNYKQLGIPVPLYHSHGVASKGFIQLAEGSAEGVRLPGGAVLVADQLPDSDPQKSLVLSYKQAYEAATKSDVSTFGGYAHDALALVVEAIKRAGGTEKAKVRDELEKTKNLMATTGVINMSDKDHLGLDLGAFRMIEVRENSWKLLN